jgi:pimeloyl-ACP methyl ester carboxylesterase
MKTAPATRTLRLVCLLILPILAGCASSSPPPPPATTQESRYVRESPANDTAIVFVHGVFGDGIATWTNGPIYWPKLLEADRAFDGANIFVHAFPSPALAPSYTIGQLADNLRLRLEANRVFANHKRVVFVCHSMGGLVVRAFLLRYREYAKQVPMIYFFSTPTTGSGLARLASVFSENPQLKQMKPVGANDPGVLANWQDDWASSGYAKSIRSFCAYEIQKTHGARVVQKESATNLCTESYDPLDRDHLTIVKPASMNDDVYLAFRNAFSETAGHRAISWGFEKPSARPAWNLVAYDHALLRVRNETRGTSCDDCQGTDIGAEPGDLITVTIHYRNDGSETARNTRVRLSIPSEPFSGTANFNATIAADDTLPGIGKVHVRIEGGPVVLIPEGDADWFVNKSTQALSLPDGQKPSDLLSADGILLGDVNAGASFQGDITLKFRCAPVVARAVKNVIQNFVPMAEKNPNFEEAELMDSLRSSFDAMCGSVEHALLRGPMWVDTISGLKAEDDLSIILSHYNAKPVPLRNVKAFIRADELNPDDLRVDITADGQPVTSGLVHLKYASDARTPVLFMATRINHRPQQSLAGILTASQFVRGDPERGLLIGDVAPRTTMLVNTVFVIADDPLDVPTDDERAMVETMFAEQKASMPAVEALRTTLNGEPADITMQVARMGDNDWADHLDALKRGDRLQFVVRYHVTGETPANDLHARLTFENTATSILGYSQLNASNAEPVNAAVRLDCPSSCAGLSLKLFAAEWTYLGKSMPVPVDAGTLQAKGLWLGDRAPDEQGSVLLWYDVERAQ